VHNVGLTCHQLQDAFSEEVFLEYENNKNERILDVRSSRWYGIEGQQVTFCGTMDVEDIRRSTPLSQATAPASRWGVS